LRPALLPEDLRYMGVDQQALQASLPRLSDWLGKVFAVMGGFMAGAGVLIAYFGAKVMPLRPRGAGWALALTGALTLGLMSVVNFVQHSDSRWLLVVPPIGWFIAVALYQRGEAN
jgi:peptidoglycan/LPS O-acetylase OafA/YrhL